MIQVYLFKFGQSFEDVGNLKPFPIMNRKELPKYLKIVTPTADSKGVIRIKQFKMIEGLTIDGLPAYKEIEENEL